MVPHSTFLKLQMSTLPCALRKVVPAPVIEDHQDHENKYVHQVYEATAGHFSHTRSRTWPAVLKFCQSLNSGTVLVDCGCGNGRNMLLCPGFAEFGIDYSSNLCTIAMQGLLEKTVENHGNSAAILRGDILSIPILSETVDAVICIAVIHHLSAQERRQQAFVEIYRILRPAGKALVTLWAREQGEKELPSEALIPWRSQTGNQYHKITMTEIFTPEAGKQSSLKNPTLSVQRYYHLYSRDEALEDAEKAGFHVSNCVLDSGNWTLTLLRPVSSP
ncbi:Methyltransferase [Giardia duodenalis]|uniref:Methyltransferase n=1 Tax=Giardia intestinalis TaxID=5741 RepID=V6TII1_GIAIN|nr:Methyltransferase [Giardia intestinalis]